MKMTHTSALEIDIRFQVIFRYLSVNELHAGTSKYFVAILATLKFKLNVKLQIISIEEIGKELIQALDIYKNFIWRQQRKKTF